MGTRRKGRILAFQVLYSYEFFNKNPDSHEKDALNNQPAEGANKAGCEAAAANSGKLLSADRDQDAAAKLPGKSLEELLDFSWLDETKNETSSFYQEAKAFARLIVIGTIQNLEKIDSIIKNQLENWDFKRLSRVDLAILRMSVYCLYYQQDIPQTVTIDEAVDIAKEYSTEDSYRFINGVLDGIIKSAESKS
jgi:N utilization substance protein B